MAALIRIYEIYIKENDRLAFITFNHNIDVVFELQPRGKNDIFINKFLTDASKVIC